MASTDQVFYCYKKLRALLDWFSLQTKVFQVYTQKITKKKTEPTFFD